MKGGEEKMDEEQYNVGLMLEQHLKEDYVGFNKIECISVGDLLQKEITKKSDFGKRIYDSRKNYSYIQDEIVIDLVQKHIEECEARKNGWILEGFPRTRLQALALQSWKYIPDKFYMLNIPDHVSVNNLTAKLKQGGTRCVYNSEQELVSIARNAITEYRVSIAGVKDQFGGSIIEIDGNKNKRKIVEEMTRLLRLKKSDAPRKPPMIIMMGPPGVDLKEHSTYVATKYNLCNIDPDTLVSDYIKKDGEGAAELKQFIKNGEPVPEEIGMRLLKQKLDLPECKKQGWILQSSPDTL